MTFQEPETDVCQSCFEVLAVYPSGPNGKNLCKGCGGVPVAAEPVRKSGDACKLPVLTPRKRMVPAQKAWRFRRALCYFGFHGSVKGAVDIVTYQAGFNLWYRSYLVCSVCGEEMVEETIPEPKHATYGVRPAGEGSSWWRFKDVTPK